MIRNARALEDERKRAEALAAIDRAKTAFFSNVSHELQAFVRHLQHTGRRGRVVNVSSVHEELPFPHFASYCASKGGVKMMMRNLASAGRTGLSRPDGYRWEGRAGRGNCPFTRCDSD
jgi:NAD(P)-dependent dehydrogenase (short-subunit alcohol dehydrogenase family)